MRKIARELRGLSEFDEQLVQPGIAQHDMLTEHRTHGVVAGELPGAQTGAVHHDG
jgi:hypothetical protein